MHSGHLKEKFGALLDNEAIWPGQFVVFGAVSGCEGDCTYAKHLAEDLVYVFQFGDILVAQQLAVVASQ